ncbi:MAG: MerR family transcriptional regulator, partial [Acidimicrobiales bacterium]
MDEAGYSVDDLARQAGTTVRNVRLYQERGLLPPPRRDGRRGVYSREHLERLRLVLSMLKRGYPLTAIRELVEAWAARRSLGDVLGFEEVLAAPYADEEPVRLSLGDVAAAFPGGGPGALARGVELGIIMPDGDHFLAPSPALYEAGAQLVADGVAIGAVLDNAAAIGAATDELAARFVALFVEHVWQPFVDAGMPAGDLRRITEVLAR